MENTMNQGYPINNPFGSSQRGNLSSMGTPIQYPYNNLIMNSPYDNYMGRNPQINNNQFLKCRPVSSKEQARAFQIDLDGSLWVFTDVGNEKIYTKQINNDGTATFHTYALAKDEEISYNSNQYVTKDEFNKVIQSLMAVIQQQPQSSTNQQKDTANKGTLMNF